MFKKKETFTVKKFSDFWFENELSFYHNLNSNVESMIKKYGNMKCLAKHDMHLSLYDIFNFVHNGIVILVFQNGVMKNYNEIDIHNNAILLGVQYDPRRQLIEQEAQVYIYEQTPFNSSISLYDLEEIKPIFDDFNAIDLTSGNADVIQHFVELDKKKEYIFVSRNPLVSCGKSSYAILRYSPNCKYSKPVNLFPFK